MPYHILPARSRGSHRYTAPEEGCRGTDLNISSQHRQYLRVIFLIAPFREKNKEATTKEIMLGGEIFVEPWKDRRKD